MTVRKLESETRMRLFLANNPMGELVKVVCNECKRNKKRRPKETSQ
jgi:hypothetical protein